MKREDRIVPRAKMPNGIELCKDNITEFLKDAKLLIDNATLSHAYISVQFAIEELGKILIFRDKIKNDASDPLVIKRSEAFTGHKGKTQKALKFLGKDVERVFDEGVFERGVFEEEVFVQDTYVEHQTRCDCAFVDFYADNWHVGKSIKKELLFKVINRIEEKLPEA